MSDEDAAKHYRAAERLLEQIEYLAVGADGVEGALYYQTMATAALAHAKLAEIAIQ